MIYAEILWVSFCFPTDLSIFTLETVHETYEKDPNCPLWCVYYVPEKMTWTKELLSAPQYMQTGSKSRLLMLQVRLKNNGLPMLKGPAPIPTSVSEGFDFHGKVSSVF